MRTMKYNLNHASQLLLDYLMNDPKQQDHMHQYIKHKFELYGHDLDDLNRRINSDDLEEVEQVEKSPEYNLYYSLTCQWHSKVLADAIIGLSGT